MMFRVLVEYTNGNTKIMTMDKETWFNIVYFVLERADDVVNYRVENIKEV